MSPDLPPIRTHLYAPGNNARLLAKVFSAGADAVILDLEDAVPPAAKLQAQQMVDQVLRQRAGQPGPVIFVRINHPSTTWSEADVRAAVQPGLGGLRIPKVEDAETVRRVASWIEQSEMTRGMPSGSVVLICGIESAVGLWHATEIAAAHPRVLALGFGAADFTRDLGITPGPDGLETLHACSQLVLASRVAGIHPPIDSVYRFLDDPAGLEKNARQAKAVGFFGKSVIHPKQVSIVNSIYTPTGDEIAHARKIVTLAEQAEAQGSGAIQNSSGEFVDVAVVRRAQAVLALADRLANHPGV